MKNILLFCLFAVFVGCFAISHSPRAMAAENEEITFFAAASATNALTDIANLYKEQGHGTVNLSFASSSTLAKQIDNGAPVQLFLSANQEWMDFLEKNDRLELGTRADLLGNRLVMIVPADSPITEITIDSSLDIAALLGADNLLAVADPAHVPVGMYAKSALEKLGLWSQVEGRIAPAKDVRAGMALVERKESPLGIVYGSDSVVSDKIRVVGTFPLDSHPAIDYPVGVIKGQNSAATQAFLQFVSSPDAKTIWAKYGFEVKE